MAHGPATASGLARELGYSQRRVQETLMEMQLGGRFQARFDGNRKEYSIESSKGWQLLFEATPERAAWFDWRASGRAVTMVWKAASAMKEEGLTEYLFESEMAKALDAVRGDFTAAGLALSSRPSMEEFLEKLKQLEWTRIACSPKKRRPRPKLVSGNSFPGQQGITLVAMVVA